MLTIRLSLGSEMSDRLVQPYPLGTRDEQSYIWKL